MEFSRSLTLNIMARNIIVHLGLHKTATTSLQEFFKGKSTDMVRKGTRYIPLQRMRTDVTPLFWTLDKGRRRKLTSFIQEIEQETVLLSDENLVGNPSELMLGGLYPHARNRIETFCEDMKDHSITLFMTLREPHPFLTSMYSEFIRHNEFVPFEQYLAAFDITGFSYRKSFGWMLKLPSNTRVRMIPFEVSEGGGVHQIARGIVTAACGPDHGIDIDSFPERKSRSSYSTEELELAAEIARRADPKMSQVFLNALDARGRRFGQTKYSPLRPKLVDELNQRYRADLQHFSDLNRG